MCYIEGVVRRDGERSWRGIGETTRGKNEKEKVYRRVLKLISTERKREGYKSEDRDQ